MKTKTRQKDPAKSLLGLTSLFYSLGVAEMGIGLACKGLAKMFANETKKRLLEFKLMGVIEIEVRDKHKKTKIEYHPLKGIKKYLERFIKKNPKYVYEKEIDYEVVTGRYILTRVYRTYNKKVEYEDEDCCPECGREYY